MMVIKFRNADEHYELLKKVKKMKKFTEELEECLEEAMDGEEAEYRGRSYRHDDDEDIKMESRYGYRRMRG